MNFTTLKMKQLNSKKVLTTVMRFSELRTFCTTTFRKNSSDIYYQRESDKNNIKKIKKFIIDTYQDNIDKNIILFPTPIIIAVNPLSNVNFIESDFDEQDIREDEILLTKLLNNNDKAFDLKMKNVNKDSFIIVDGQHRFHALDEIYEKNKTFDIELSVLILVDYNIYEQSKVFTNVNFNQKPVNKSLVYDIFGTVNEEIEGIPSIYKLCYKIVNGLNDDILKNIIKMLGTGDGIISQAFVTETLKDILEKSESKSNTNYFKKLINNYKSGGKLDLNYINSFFNYLKNKYKELWPKYKIEYLDEKLIILKEDESQNSKKIEELEKKIEETKPNIYSGYYYKHLLLKTTGFYVILNFMYHLFSKQEYIELIERKEPLDKMLKSDLSKLDLNKYFKEGSIDGTGKGIQSKILKELISDYENGK